jgi:hypothetical protein
MEFLEIGIVANRLDALLQRNCFVVVGHHGHGSELQLLCQIS